MKKFLFLYLPFFSLFSACSFLPQPSNSNYQPEIHQKNYYENTKQKPETDEKKKETFLKNEQKQADESQTYKISHVIDGDTIYIIVNGIERKIRILGIDTPEKNGGFRTAECFGDDASEYAKEYLKGKRVSVLKSKIGNSEDKYGRWLRYVFVDGIDFGAHLIETGYAESYKRFRHDRKKYYNSLEKKAQKEKKGMWNEENCSYWGQEG